MVRSSSITMPSVVGIMGHVPAVDEKVWCFLSVCLSRFGITKFVITETLWSSEIFKTIMVPLHRGRFLVVHLYSSLWTPSIFFMGKFIPKIAILGDFGSRKATFLKPQKWKLAWLWVRGRPSPTPNFVKKNCLRGYTTLGQIYTKNYQFLQLWWL